MTCTLIPVATKCQQCSYELIHLYLKMPNIMKQENRKWIGITSDHYKHG